MASDNKSILGKARAKFIELYSRVIKIEGEKDDSIFHNGENNLYPNEIELAILNSPSGKNASKMMAKFISGKGVKNDVVVNEDKNYNLSKIIKIASTDVSRQNGVFFHVGRKLNDALELVPVLDILEYTKMRIGKEDDNEVVTKYWFKDYEKTKSFLGNDKDKSYFYYPYSDNKNVILEQIKADYILAGGKDLNADLSIMLPYYRGQVYYMNLTPEFKYALSPFDAVYNDLDTESRISMYINRQVRTGFLGKTYVVTAGLDEEDEKQVEADVKLWLGSENVGGTYHFSIGATDDIDKVFKVGQMKAEIDEKLFTETKNTVKSNIYAAANNIPEQLIKSDNTLFGTSADTYVEMKKFYTEQTLDERTELENTLTFLGFPCKIIPLTEEEALNTEVAPVDDATKEAQANLRGSVGGVQGVLGVQQSFANGLTDYNSAITIFTEIYGFSLKVADALLGSPEQNPTTNEPTTNAI